MEKKTTKRELFTEMLAAYNLKPQHEELIKHEIELLEKKAAKDRKPTATQLANVGIKEDIVAVLANAEKMTCTEIAKALQPSYTEPMTVNKVSAMMKQLIESGKVVKTTEKRKAYFSVA